MKILLFLSLFCGLCLLVACDSRTLPQDEAMKEFIYTYQEAHKAKDSQTILDLFYWEGVDESYRKRMKEAVAVELEMPLSRVEYLPLEEGDKIDYYSKGNTYGPNLTPVGKLHFSFLSQEYLHFTQLVGKLDDRYYFVQPAPVKK